MTHTYIQRHVARTSRNLLVVNGIILLILAFFTAFIVLGAAIIQKGHNDMETQMSVSSGGEVLGASEAVDLSHPTPLNVSEVTEARLGELEGTVVKLNAPQTVDMMFPVAFWSARATGKKKPVMPPNYFVVQTNSVNPNGGAIPGGPPPGMPNMPGMINPMGGPPLIIIPADAVSPSQPRPSTFIGVIRPLKSVDQDPVEIGLKARGLQIAALPYVLDCLNVGAKKAPFAPLSTLRPGLNILGSLTFLLPFLALYGLTLWNVVKGVRRLKNPLSHPIYETLARYGNPADIERHIEADYQRGVQQLPPTDLTSSWLLAQSFWTLDAVPLNYVVWIYRPRKIRFGRAMLLRSIIAAHTLIMLDRLGKQHVIRSEDGQLNQIMAAITQGRPWMETGENSPLRRQFASNKAGFIAAIEARRQQMTVQPPQYNPPPTQPNWVAPSNP